MTWGQGMMVSDRENQASARPTGAGAACNSNEDLHSRHGCIDEMGKGQSQRQLNQHLERQYSGGRRMDGD
jgi:hypothetical protein